MTNSEALALLKMLVALNQFKIVNRRETRAEAVTSALAKEIVRQLSKNDFEKYEPDRNRKGEFVWVFVTEYGVRYYLKFKFMENDTFVKFISFHEANY